MINWTGMWARGSGRWRMWSTRLEGETRKSLTTKNIWGWKSSSQLTGDFCCQVEFWSLWTKQLEQLNLGHTGQRQWGRHYQVLPFPFSTPTPLWRCLTLVILMQAITSPFLSLDATQSKPPPPASYSAQIGRKMVRFENLTASWKKYKDEKDSKCCRFRSILTACCNCCCWRPLLSSQECHIFHKREGEGGYRPAGENFFSSCGFYLLIVFCSPVDNNGDSWTTTVGRRKSKSRHHVNWFYPVSDNPLMEYQYNFGRLRFLIKTTWNHRIALNWSQIIRAWLTWLPNTNEMLVWQILYHKFFCFEYISNHCP